MQINNISYFFSYFCLFLLVLLHIVYYFSFTFLYNTMPKILWLWMTINVKILRDKLNFYIPKAKMGDSRMSRVQPQTSEVSIQVVRFFFIFYIQIPCKQHCQTLHEYFIWWLKAKRHCLKNSSSTCSYIPLLNTHLNAVFVISNDHIASIVYKFPLPPCHTDKISSNLGIKNPKPHAHTKAVVFKHPVNRLQAVLHDLEMK